MDTSIDKKDIKELIIEYLVDEIKKINDERNLSNT